MGFDLTSRPEPEDRPPSRAGTFIDRDLDADEDRPPRTQDERMAAYWTSRPAIREAPEPLEAPPRLDEEQQGDVTLGIPERSPRRGLATLGVFLGGMALTGVLVWVLVTMLTSTSSGGGGTSPQTTDAPATSAAGEIGQPVRLGTLALKVQGIRDVPASASERPAAGMRWVAVDVEIVNEGVEEQRVIMDLMFDLEAEGGASFSPVIIGSVARYAEGDLAPGLRLRGEVVFEIPIEAKPDTFVATAADGASTVSIRVG
jgi:uncharacterized protein DUF4352